MIEQKIYTDRSAIIFLLLIGSTFIALGQPQFIKSTLISAEQGVEGLMADRLFLDNEQRLWLKTETAINIYDGNETNVLKKGVEEHDLHSSKAIEAFVDRGAYVDIYYKKETSFFDRHYKNTHYVDSIALEAFAPQDTVVRSIISYDKTLWFFYKNTKEYYFFNTQTKASIHSAYLQLENNFSIQKITAGQKGFWVLDENFITYFLPYQKQAAQLKYLPPEKLISFDKKIRQLNHVFQEDSLRNLWISYPGMKGIFRKNVGAAKINKVENLPTDKGLYVFMWQDQKGRALFGLSRKYMYIHHFYLRDGSGTVIYWEELSDFTNIPTTIYSKDFYDYLFLGTYRELQILEFSRPFIDVYYKRALKYKTGKYGNLVVGGIPTNDGSFFIAEECKWHKLHDGKTTQINIENDIVCRYKFVQYAPETNTIYSLRRSERTGKRTGPEYGRPRLLSIDVATLNYDYIDVGKEIYSYTVAPNRQLYLIYKDVNESFHLGLYQVGTKQLKHLRELNPIKEEIAQFIYDPRQACIWILFEKDGLYQIDLKKSIGLKPINLNFGEQAVKYNDVNLGEKDDLWVSTSEGAILLDATTQKIKQHISKKQGLQSKYVCGVISQDGFSWISTFYGLYAYDIANKNLISVFENDGLPTNEFNTRAVHKGLDGQLYFGGANGLVSVKPSVFKEYGKDFFIYLRGIAFHSTEKRKVINQLSDEILEIHQSDQQVLKVNVGSSFWGDYLNTSYLYLMEGIDKDWKKINGHHSIRYDRLPIGQYTLHIKGVSPIGIHSQNELLIKIEVTAPFYKKTPFIITAISGLVGLLIFLFTRGYYNSRKKRESEKLQYEKRISQLELMALQSQMNPHFIFNAINAIQEYLWSNDKEFVEKYLNDFAKLTRLYLESSKVKVITLEQEIELLRLYSALEKLRFQERIEVNIDVSENIEPRYFKIPSMMVQPFVENAINHGLFHKEGKGTVNIVIFEKKEKVHIIVQDDGIGRAAAKKIKNESLNNYKSRALQITEERIEVLKKHENVTIDINIEDLFDENGQAIGTKIEIIIPEMY